MRIVHLADTHLGFRQFSGKLDPERRLNQRECDVYDAWHTAIGIAIDRRVDAVIHAGDLFDSPRPTMRAMAEAIDGFRRLADAGIPVIAIAGNHSTPRFRSGGSVFEILQRFGVQAAWSAPETFRVGDVAFHAVPHEADAEQLKADIDGLTPDASAAANVLILHAGLDAVGLSTYGEVGAISLDAETLVRAPFDYIAMGHLHRFQVPQVNAIYPGSLERLDFADDEGTKAVLEIDLAIPAGQSGFVRQHALDTRTMIDVALPCTGMDPTAVHDAVEAAMADHVLEGAMVRVRLEGLQRDVWGALDFTRFDECFRDCLHHVMQVARDGLLAGPDPDVVQAELRFDAWARERMPPGVDPERVIGIAASYLEDAARAEVEAITE